jgi:uncharacterized hydantoinase/oxoprolinase family protein
VEVIDYVKKFLENYNINDIILLEEHQEGSAATYNFATKELAIDTTKVLKEADRLNLSVEDMVSVVVSHELGHYMDPELEQLYKNKKQVLDIIDNEFSSCDLQGLLHEGVSYVVQAEKNAWDLGRKFVPEKLSSVYNQEMKENLNTIEVATMNKISEFIEAVSKREKLK